MKGFKSIVTCLSIVFSFQIAAQTDLNIVSSQTSYQFDGDGQTNIITFEFDNLGPDIASGANVTFTKDMFIDPTFDFISVSSGDFNCAPNGDSMNCTLIATSFDPFTPVFIDLGVIIQPGDFDLAPAFLVNITDPGGQDTILTNNNLSVDIQYTAGVTPDFQVTLLNPALPIQYPEGGGTQTMTFEIENIGPVGEGDQTTVTFDISSDLDPQFTNPASGDSSDPAWFCVPSSTQVICDYGGIFNAGAISQLNLNIPTPDVAPIPAIINNAVGVSMFNVLGDPDPFNNTFQYDIEITSGGTPEIEVTKSIVGNLTEVIQGGELEYLVEVNNTGAGIASNVDLVDILPPGVTYQSHTELGPNFNCTFAGVTLTCNAANLPVTASQDGVIINVTADGNIGTAVANTATSAFLDSNPSDNTSSVLFNIIAPIADLDITINSDQTNYVVGDVITHDLTLHNPFASTGKPRNTVLTVTLSNETTFASAQETSGIGFSCAHDGSLFGGDVVCNSQSNELPIGSNTFFEIIANAATETQTTSSDAFASITSEFDPNPSNDLSATSFFITAADADLSLVFTSTGATYNQGDIISYALQAENPMISTANPSDVTITVNLPVEVVFNDTDLNAAPDWVCVHDGSVSGGVVDCDRGGVPFNSFTTDNLVINVVADSPATGAVVTAQINSAADSNAGNNNASQADAINPAVSDFSIAKTVNGTDFAIGDAFTYVLTVSNPAASTASPTDVVISDQLPAEVSFDNFIIGSSLGTNINCIHDGSTNGGLLSCNTAGDPFPSGETITIDINVSAEVANNNVNNSATIETSTDPDGTANNNTDNAPTVVINGPLVTTLNATKTASVAGVNVGQINYGENFEYILSVENTGLNDAFNVNVTDTLPPEVTLSNILSTGWTCTNVAVKSAGGEDINCTLDTPLPPANTAQIVVAVVATSDTNVTSIINQMQVNGDNTGPQVTADVTVSLINSQAALLITQNPSSVNPGEDVEFAHLITNTGLTDLNGIQASSELPTGFTFNGFNGSAGWSCSENAGTVNCIFTGTLASSGTLNLNLELTSVVPQLGQTYGLTTTLSANELAVDVAENITVSFSRSDYSLTIRSVPTEVNSGEPFTHIVSLRNTGNFDITNVVLSYINTDGAEVTAFTAPGLTCSVTAGLYSCVNNQPLVVNGAYEAEVTLVAENSISSVNGNVAANAGGIRKSAETTTVINAGFENDLAISLNASATSVNINTNFSYQVTVNNLGTVEQNGFGVTSTLPNGVVFQNVNGTNWTCVGVSVIDCQFNGTLLSTATTQFELNVIAPIEAGEISYSANINSAADENPANNMAQVSVNVTDTGVIGDTARADLNLDVQVNSDDLLNTDQVQWQIKIENLGPDSAENVRLSNMLPMGFIAESVQVSAGTECILLSSSLQCDIASLAVNQSSEVLLEGSFANDFEGVLLNSFEVESDTIDPNPSNNLTNREVVVTAAQNLVADLALELNVSDQQVQQGDVLDLSLTASNLGPDKAVNARIDGTVAGLIDSIQILSSGGWICQANGNSLSCVFPGDLNVGMSTVIDVSVVTQQVVQDALPILVNATITSDSMDTVLSNNLVGFTSDVSRTPSESEIFNLFQNAVGSAASETVIQSIRNVSSYCARSYFTAIEGLCEEFIEDATPENGAAIINAMEELTPNEVAAQSNSAAEIITSQIQNVGSRLAQLRGGGGSGFSVAGLNARYGNESIPLGMLAYLNQSEEEQQAVSNINDFVSPWGFFVNGSISMGERDATGRELGFDFDTFGVTAGVDYRFSPTKVAGLALGYANFDSEIEGEAEMQSTGLTLTGYGSFYLKDNFYVDGRISYGQPDFEQKRRINFAVDEIIIDRVAAGKTDANQYSVAMSAGYHFNKNSWLITPNAQFRYVRTTIDAFQESGAGGFNFAFGEQEVESMVWSLGASVSKAISLKNGVISPQFDFNFSRETENDGGLLEARFINAPDDEIFWIGTDEPDRTFGSAGVGLVFIGANGKQAYINYRSIFGLEGFTRGTINLGARFEF